jgi:hypothetical protein
MTRAYAVRTLVAIAHLQGYIEYERVTLQQKIFSLCQIETNTSAKFQQDAADAAIDFMRQYSTWFTKEKLGKITAAALSGDLIDNHSLGIILNDDDIKKIIDNI